MQTPILLGIVALAVIVPSTSIKAQNMSFRGPPPGTVAACGTAPGYYRPQPFTLTSRGRPTRNTNNTYYAPVGPKQKDWYQYYPSSNTYGQKEPNPFNEKGHLSIPRTTRHLYVTRIQRPASNYVQTRKDKRK
jgi:hypothetical protein